MMQLSESDLASIQAELAGTFRSVAIESDVVGGYDCHYLTIVSAPDLITVMLAPDAVIHAGDFTTEVLFDGRDFGRVRAELVRMARDGYHAVVPLIGISSSGFGPARPSFRRVLISRDPWPEALIEEVAGDASTLRRR